jgi:hypothetical protein
MNARRVPFEAPKERRGVCFGGFRPAKHVEEPWALARGAPLSQSEDDRRTSDDYFDLHNPPLKMIGDFEANAVWNLIVEWFRINLEETK